jgi:hypothetical protein
MMEVFVFRRKIATQTEIFTEGVVSTPLASLFKPERIRVC